MSTSVFEILNGLITPNLMNAVGPLVGLSADTASRGIGDAVTRYLGALVEKAGDEGAMASIADATNALARDQSGLSDLKGLLAGGIPSTTAILSGNRLMGSLFGVWQASQVHKIADVLGIKPTASSSLFNLAAPLVLSAIGRRLGGGALTGPALAALLGQERSSLLSGFLPSLGGLATAATSGVAAAATSGAAALAGGAATATRAAVSTTTNAASAAATAASTNRYDRGIFSSFLWLLLPIGFMGWLIWEQLNHKAVPEPETPVAAAPEPAPAAEPEPAPAALPEPAPEPEPAPAAEPALAAGGLARIGLAGGTDIEAAADGVETKLVEFISNPDAVIDKGVWFDFDRLTFETASSNLTMESKAQVDNVIAILNAYPAVKVKIGGYTDNTGNPAFNLRLSDDRAKKVMQAIVDGGIAADRVEAEGYGDQHPVADNSTEEGRAKNRRTAISVRAK